MIWTDNEICDEGACALSEALKVNTTLTTLDLTSLQQQTMPNNEHNKQATKNKTANKIGDEGASSLSEALKVNTSLTELDLWEDDEEEDVEEDDE